MSMSESVMGTEGEGGQGAKEKLMADLKAVVADAEELLKASASQTGERIAAARIKAEESLKAAKARLAEEGAAAMARAKSAARATDDFVRAHPWKAVGVAAVVGVVLGLLAARR